MDFWVRNIWAKSFWTITSCVISGIGLQPPWELSWWKLKLALGQGEARSHSDWLAVLLISKGIYRQGSPFIALRLVYLCIPAYQILVYIEDLSWFSHWDCTDSLKTTTLSQDSVLKLASTGKAIGVHIPIREWEASQSSSSQFNWQSCPLDDLPQHQTRLSFV